jgi:LmbE family N-acetylglucosaminyl deacetylase
MINYSKSIVVAPHPDDEVFGAGGTILRRKTEGAQVAWLVLTAPSADLGWTSGQVQRRAGELRQVAAALGFDQVFNLDFPAAQLDRLPMAVLVQAVAEVFEAFRPEEVFVPHPADAHTDHRLAFTAVASCAKWFRQPSVKRLLAYETLSETDAGLGCGPGFRPSLFVDITPYLEAKLQAMSIYASELGEFPFPRSLEAARALASLRGAASGFKAAEAFELLRERT